MIKYICYIFFEDMLILFVLSWPLFMHGSGNYLLFCAFLDVKFTKMHPWGLSLEHLLESNVNIFKSARFKYCSVHLQFGEEFQFLNKVVNTYLSSFS